MLLKFGKEIWSFKGSPKWVFSLFWWVQTFWLISFGSMLFFGPSFSHLMCYFNYFL